jgi:hypothetical protein
MSASFWYIDYQYMYIRQKLLGHTSSIHIHKQEAFGTHTTYVYKQEPSKTMNPVSLPNTDETLSVFWFL